MAVEYHVSQMTNMDVDDSQIAYKKLFSDARNIRFSVYALRNNPFKVASICFGLLCVLLLACFIGTKVHYSNVIGKQESEVKSLTTDKEKLQQNLKTLQQDKWNLEKTRNQLQEIRDRSAKTIDQQSSNINTLSDELFELKNKHKQLENTNSATNKELGQLKADKAQLLRDKEILVAAQTASDARYQSAAKLTKSMQESVNLVTKDRDIWQNKYNNATRLRDQLQMNYNSLIQKVEHLQEQYNHSTSEKDKITGSHQNLTIELQTLQTTYSIIKTAQNELQASYESVVQEKQQLQTRIANITEERDLLKIKAQNLTAERNQLQETVNQLNSTIQEKKCPAGWRKFKYSCYFTSSVKNTWQQSREFCQNNTGDLAVIKSEEEMAFINSLYSSDQEAWIGLTDGGIEGQWKWVDGTPLTQSFWAKGQPNSHQGRNQDCVEFWHRAKGNGDWNDESCSVKQNWICEI
ncbi:C-type lectin domain family 4 member M [Oryzias melastigma]|uniref:C-type lectin domain family 4 member M-like n=2 Tax=Oryzias melastigma TaxID=30732 RepID=A0A3B3DLF8_ORYME|nr:C-type lectin domain family 4 member M [Oryzias melastigma]